MAQTLAVTSVLTEEEMCTHLESVLSRDEATIVLVPSKDIESPDSQLPVWADIVKTGMFKELAPNSDNWYYVRAASIARKIYLRPGTGVGALQKWYGVNYWRGTRGEHFRKASSGIIRSMLAQLEEMKVVEKLGVGEGG